MGAPQPGRPTGEPPPSDEQPSPRIAAAASMLRNGHHPALVAAVTDVPFTLVQLIAEHLPPSAARPGRPGPPTADQPPAGHRDENGGDPTGDRLDAIVRTDAQQARQHPRRGRILWGVVICAVVNAALGVVGVLTQVDALAVICLTMTPLIYAVALLLLLFLPRPVTPARHHRR